LEGSVGIKIPICVRDHPLTLESGITLALGDTVSNRTIFIALVGFRGSYLPWQEIAWSIFITWHTPFSFSATLGVLPPLLNQRIKIGLSNHVPHARKEKDTQNTSQLLKEAGTSFWSTSAMVLWQHLSLSFSHAEQWELSPLNVTVDLGSGIVKI
jgi:hypothetical protein